MDKGNIDDPLDHQVGGDHYLKYNPSPIRCLMLWYIPFVEGCAFKHVLRYKDKNGIEDLKKANNELSIAIQYGSKDYFEFKRKRTPTEAIIRTAIEQWELEKRHAFTLECIVKGTNPHLHTAKDEVKALIRNMEKGVK